MKATLKDLINHVCFVEVAEVMKKEYPYHWKKSGYGYENVFNRLKQLDPVEMEGEIVIQELQDLLDGGTFLAVSYRENGTTNDPSFLDFRQWLGTTIAEEIFNQFTIPEIVAHCLWEMTFNGFSEMKIQEVKKEIKKVVDELLAN